MRITPAVIVLAFVLAGCGGDDTSSGGADQKPDGSSPSVTQTEEGVPADAEVCDLVGETDVEAAYGADVPPGDFVSGGHNVNGIQWASENCNWFAQDGLEVSLELSTAEDFQDGRLLCPELDSFDVPATPVDGLEAEASWVADQIDPNEGALRFCTDTHLFTIEVESGDGSRDPDTLRDQSVALAEVVLANLG